jgi:hypothetical protein
VSWATYNLKYGEKECAIEIVEANDNYQHANHLRKQLIKIQDLESEISVQIQTRVDSIEFLLTIRILIGNCNCRTQVK